MAAQGPGGARPLLIPEFYAGRHIFITGATGFCGKVLVERLLYTCRDICGIHLLTRTKKDQPPEKRMVLLKQSPVFDVVRRECPQQLDKLHCVSGDTSQPGLGLAADTRATLSEVSVIFHCAATVRFDEALEKATEENVRSVLRLMDLADTLPRMEVFVHVSTAYCNTERREVGERVYAAPLAHEQLFALVDNLPASTLARIVPHLLGEKPNTYTFTKAIAESAFAERRTRYARAIFRPTMVVSSLRTPFPGWLENANGPAMLVVLGGKGLLHTFRADQSVRPDFIPVDIAIDTMIAAAWQLATQRPSEVRVYNSTATRNRFRWREFYFTLRKSFDDVPFDNVYWYPSGGMTCNKYLNKFREVMFQTLPLHIAEYVCKIFGVKTKMSLISVSRKLSLLTQMLCYFSLNEWTFRDDAVRALQDSLAPQDAAVFNLDPHSINWDEHLRNFVLGTRKYLLQEKDEDIKAAKKHYNRLWLLHTSLKWLLLALACRLALRQSALLRQLLAGSLRTLLALVANFTRRAHA